MQRRCEPVVAHVEAVEDGVVVTGKRGELLKVLALQKDIVHVTHIPDGRDTAPVDKTWVVTGESTLGGDRRRDDHEALNQNPEHFTYVQSEVHDGIEVRTENLRVVVGAAKLGANRPFRLQWYTADASAATYGAADDQESKPFAEDAVLSAYAYDAPHGRATHRMERKPDVEYYYGVGEVTGLLNRAGRRFELACRDAMGYDAETSDALYKHFPFYITYNKEAGVAYGILYDQLCGGYLDLGKEISAFRGNFRTYASVAGFVDYYLILGPSVAEVVEKLGYLVGRPAVPPAWALGYVASTMTYADAPDAQQRLEAFPALCERNEMPCDGFYLSSGYTMDADGNRNVFTWNKERVPDPERMLGVFRRHNMGVIANVKPWLLEAHPEYADMEALGGFFRTNEHASDDDVLLAADDDEYAKFVKGWFWKGGPGTFASGSYLDFTNPVAFDWWKAKLKKQVLGPGVDAVWNDNNEFEVDDDGAVCHQDDAPIALLGRTLQPLLMARASFEALCEARPEKRPLVVSRSGCLGISKFAAQTWSGDNSTSFHTLKWNIPMSLGLSLCGWVGCGPDIGGFVGDAVTPELFVRWIQLGVYMARFSIHSSSWKASATPAAGTPDDAVVAAAAVATEDDDAARAAGYNLDCTNEPWMFPEMTATVRSLLQLRVRLRPLLLSLHIEAWRTSAPVMRPLAYRYVADASERSRTESFEFTLGPDLLVAAVLDGGEDTRQVYFPGDAVGESWCDLYTGMWYSGGTEALVHAPLQGRTFGAPVFLRNGGGLVLADIANARVRNVILAANPGQTSQDIVVEWFEDPTPAQEGVLRDPSADVSHIRICASATADEVVITSIERTGPQAPIDEIRFELVPADHRQLVQAAQAN